MNERIGLSAILVLTVTATVLLFARTRMPLQGAGPATSGDPAARAAAAHAAAGIGVPAADGGSQGGDGDVARTFLARVHALERRVEEAPDDPELRRQLARLLHDGHRAADAVIHYRELLRLDPDDAQAVYDLAAAHGELGEWVDAESVLLVRVERAPDDAVALYDLGAVRANLGDAEGARGWLVRARAATEDEALLSRIEQALSRLDASGSAPGS